MDTRFYRILNGAAWILLPSFLVAAAIDIVYFEIFNPVHPPFGGNPLESADFAEFLKVLVLLWGFTAAGILLSILLSFRLRRR